MRWSAAYRLPHQRRLRHRTRTTTLHAALGLDAGMLKFHREDPKTTHKHCPGANIKKLAMVKELRSRLVLESAGEHASAREIAPA